MKSCFKAYWKNEDGVASIESAFVLPIVFAIFFACIQIVILMLNQTTMQNGVDEVIASYEEMYIKNQTALSQNDIRNMICRKMMVESACADRLSVQLHSYRSTDISNLHTSGQNNSWSELDEYYVSFVRVDYEVLNIMPFFSTVMRSPDETYTISNTFVVSPGKIRNGTTVT